MDENVNGAETTMAEIVDEMGTTPPSPSETTFGVNPPLSSAAGGEEASRPLSGEALESGSGSPERGAGTAQAVTEGSSSADAAQTREGSEPSDRRDELTRGLVALAEDGWTDGELRAFSQDEQAVRDIAEGRSLESTALRYMRRTRSAGSEGKATPAPAKRSVPTMRSAGAGETDAGDPIARMSDKEFDAFYARAMEKAMTGAKVCI